MQNRLIIKNASLVLPNEIIHNGYLICENGLITAFGEGLFPPRKDDYVIDACHRFVSPGFIDIHIHGASGHDFMDNSVEAYLGVARSAAQYGTTSMLPTTLASSNEELFETFRIYREAKRLNTDGALFLGLHLEGPYFSFEQRGAQDPRYLRNPQPEEYTAILEASDDIRRWSLAPELDGALEFARVLKMHGILPSVAHTNATCEEVEAAFEAGFTHTTHLYCAMSSVTRRNAFRCAGTVEAAYLLDGMTVEVIADGAHLPKALLQFAYKFKGPDKVALCTDSIRGAGIPGTETILGSKTDGRRVIIEDGVAKLPDRSAFAGSVATADRLVRTMTNVAEVPLNDAIRMMTLTPARIIGADRRKGSIEVGKDADLVFFDEQISVSTTLIGGNIIYSHS